MKFQVYQDSENGTLGIGIKILDKKATLADLLEAWQPLCDDLDLVRPYGNGLNTPCKGCTVNCCNTAYVIPDLIAFKKIARYLKLSHEEFINNYFASDKVERGLLRLKPEPCIFLKNNICTIYPIRTLICRFYLCSSLLAATEQLIYSITWTGVTATQLFALEQGLINPATEKGLTSFDQLFINLLGEYRFNSRISLFENAENYDEIPLEPFMEA